MSRYLITGGAGFIGLALTRRLLAAGHAVTLLDLPAKLQSASPVAGALRLPGDVSQPSTFASLCGEFDTVFHLAAQTSARISHETPVVDVDTNARGTLLVAQWCAAHGIARIIYTSSMAVYGNPVRLPVCETDLPAPVSFYGVTKLAGEHYLQAYQHLGLEPTILRLFNVYGPGQDMANLKQGMISIYLAYLHAGVPIPVTGRLDRFRDFIYVDDVIEALLAVHGAPTAAGAVYNIGSGKSYTVRNVLDMLIAHYGLDPATYPVEVGESSAGDIHGMLADNSRFCTAFGWKPAIGLAEGVDRTIAWLRSGERA